MALVFDQDNILQLVGFDIGPKLFGASILSVSEILRDPTIDSVGGAPAFIEGIVRLRGAVIPVVKLGHILGVPGSSANPDKLWVLIGQAGDRRVGFIVDGVTPILRIQTEKIVPPPDLITSGMRTKFIRGVSETDKGLLVIVELERMLLEDEIKAMESINAA